MQENETVVNQTLLIWSGVVIVEFFIIAHLMAVPAIVFFSLLMAWPIRAALNWPAPSPEEIEQNKPDADKATSDAPSN